MKGSYSDVRDSVVELLNITVADEIVLATKTRSAHWNVRSADFFELHTLYAAQFQLLNNISDEIAGRARMLRSYIETEPIHGKSQKGL